MKRLILQALRAAPGPMGLVRLAAATGLEADRILAEYEPWLLTRGLIRVTTSGRSLA